MKGQRIVTGVLMLALLLSLTAGLSQAQGPESPEQAGAAGDAVSPQSPAAAEAALTTAFTYQGHLVQDGGPVTGTCDFQFSLHSAMTGAGNQVGSTQTAADVSVSDGLFIVKLNGSGEFGPQAFRGERRWLLINVRCPAGKGIYTALSPRQEVTLVPYAQTLIPGAVIENHAADGAGLWLESENGHALVGIGNNASYAAVSGEHAGAGSGVKGSSVTGAGVVGEGGDQGGYFQGYHGVYGKGMGILSDSYGVHGESNNGTGVYAHSANSVGLHAVSDSDIAVLAETSGGSAAVEAHNSSATGIGVSGEGMQIGVYGFSTSADGIGVQASSVYGDGVQGWSATGGNGVKGTSGTGTGVYAQSTSGTGVVGKTTVTTGDTTGVWGEVASSGTYARAVVGWAKKNSGTNYGVWGESSSSGGTGVYGRNSAGGIGVSGKSATGVAGRFETNSSVSSPQVLLYETENDYTRLTFQNSTSSTYWTIASLASDTDANARLHVYNSSSGNALSITGAGDVGIGTTNPTARLEVSTSTSSPGVLGKHTAGGTGVRGRSDEGVGVHGISVTSIGVHGASVDGTGVQGYSVSGDGVYGSSSSGYAGRFEGRVSSHVLEITGGSDLSEGFAVKEGEAVEPGTLMVIDADNPGHLKMSDCAYDTKVAGVVSGAGDVKPGLTLQQEGVMEGDTLVAIAGRVYVKAEATSGPIAPGDLLTTSEIPGHAMKAADRQRGQGAIIGKAMTGLDKGTGLVLVLVNLQ